ncbi:uncharacterized protein LY79DRAFT_548338 [Colletotrichum navitas]|uniref:Uncharacterized protein n=1 Tax=Colletotrichum navitas TaxID=681940 RepID=A0AAD8V582_9PEZI|nr:uncharacterized protein LY79DRAFT_548338 [Colletotrichum navitas]KAK1594737.1 hypothetical protein LY79DRAFT_548338 [Colletotrichum navitas]
MGPEEFTKAVAPENEDFVRLDFPLCVRVCLLRLLLAVSGPGGVQARFNVLRWLTRPVLLTLRARD